MFLTHIHFFHSVTGGMAKTSGTLGSIRLGKFLICFILPTYLYILSSVVHSYFFNPRQVYALVRLFIRPSYISSHLISSPQPLARFFPFSETFLIHFLPVSTKKIVTLPHLSTPHSVNSMFHLISSRISRSKRILIC